MPRPNQNLDFNGDEHRQWPRYAASLNLPLTLAADGKTYDCIIEDISLGGAKLRFKNGAPQSQEMMLQHPASGSFFGQRLWQTSETMGIQFDFSERALELVSHCVGLMLTSESGRC